MDIDILTKLYEKVIDRSVIDSGCRLFTGAKKNGYGTVKKTIDGKVYSFYAHRIVKMYTLNDLDIDHCSHLCAKRNCIKEDHISIECDAVNNQRKRCHEVRLCCRTHVALSGDALPNCIIK